jgi:hypothetical protein
MVSFAGVNWLAVLVGVVATNALGFLWYGPLFGETWLRMIGKKREELHASSSMYVVTAVASAITMVALSLIVHAFGAGSFVQGLIAGVVTWVGIGATATFVYTTFEGPPTNVWMLNAAYQLVIYAVMGGVFAIWA